MSPQIATLYPFIQKLLKFRPESHTYHHTNFSLSDCLLFVIVGADDPVRPRAGAIKNANFSLSSCFQIVVGAFLRLPCAKGAVAKRLRDCAVGTIT